jgi:hypothetical protein
MGVLLNLLGSPRRARCADGGRRIQLRAFDRKMARRISPSSSTCRGAHSPNVRRLSIWAVLTNGATGIVSCHRQTGDARAFHPRPFCISVRRLREPGPRRVAVPTNLAQSSSERRTKPDQRYRPLVQLSCCQTEAASCLIVRGREVNLALFS